MKAKIPKIRTAVMRDVERLRTNARHMLGLRRWLDRFGYHDLADFVQAMRPLEFE